MLTTVLRSVSALCLVLLPWVSASAATIAASADTYIAEHTVLGGKGSIHGTDPTLYEIGASTFRAFPLVRFDLSGFAGETVTGSAALSLNVTGIHPSAAQATQHLEARQVLVSWEEATLSWNSFGPGPISGTNVSPTALDPHTVTVKAGDVVTFSLPAAVVQTWIDSPSTNYGLLLYSTTNVTIKDIHFASKENTTASGPELSFDTDAISPAPAPPIGRGVPILIAVAGMLLARRRLLI
jgi:hypothetical protein